MQKMRAEQAKESRDITALTREFTQKLSLVEGQLKEAVKVYIYKKIVLYNCFTRYFENEKYKYSTQDMFHK